MNQSENINELAVALASAQSAMESAKTNAQNPHFRSRYADLEAIWTAAKGVLPGNGLAVCQVGTVLSGSPYLRTVLLHKSGQWIAGEIPILSKDPNDPQKFGSGWTYARRYGLAAILNIVVDDDDGNAGSQRPPSNEKPAQRQESSAREPERAASKPEPRPEPQRAQEPPKAGSVSLAEGEIIGKGHPFWRMSRTQKDQCLGPELDVVKKDGEWVVVRREAA